MAKEHEIVAEINAGLKSRVFASKRFQAGSFDGIAELIRTDEGETKPGSINNYGDATYLGIDDTKPFQLYHRVLSSQVENNDEGTFGDRVSMKQITNMLMVVMGDRLKLQLTREDLMTGIAAGLPIEFNITLLNTLGITECNVIPGQFNTDRETVYRNEFNTQENLLKTNTIMFSFPYQIETYFEQSCFSLC